MVAYDVAIVGGGLYGCAVAKYLHERSDRDLEVCIVEKEHHLAAHQSGRNSGTLHPGIVLDYESHPNRRRFGEKGLLMLREYLRENGLPWHDYGLLVVASDDRDEERLHEIKNRTTDHDIEKEILAEDELREREPHVEGQAALFAPQSGNVDGQAINYRLAADAWTAGTDFHMGCTAEDVSEDGSGVRISTDKGAIEAEYLVNAAGSWALRIAKSLGLGRRYETVPLRGAYYELVLGRRDLVNTNVYQTPRPEGIEDVRVHFTRRPDNRVVVGPTGMLALGPDTYDRLDIDLRQVRDTLSSSNFWKYLGSRDALRSAWENANTTYRKGKFVEACHALFPQVSAEDLAPSYVGIINELVDDRGRKVEEPTWVFGERSVHLVKLTPGVTASLAIGEYIADEVLERL